MVEKNGKTILTAEEWYRVERLILAHEALFVDARSSFAVMNYVIGRTLPYHKFDEWFMTREWGEGRPELGYLGIKFHRGTVLRALKKTAEFGLVEIVKFDRKWSRYHIVINVPGVLERLQVLDDAEGASACKKIKPLALKVKAYFMDQKWRSDIVHTLDDVEEIGRKASKEATARKRAKRDAKDMKVAWIYDTMKGYAEECKQPFSDNWIKKTYGQARNWLDECSTAGKDPKELLYDVANWWPAIKEALKMQYTFVGGVVSWSLYYKYRRQMEALLAENKEQWETRRARVGKIIFMKPAPKSPEPEEEPVKEQAKEKFEPDDPRGW